jgi:NADH-quinone oxidoreductase subunit E
VLLCGYSFKEGKLTPQNQAKAVEPWQEGVDAAINRFGKTRTSLLSSLEAVQDAINFVPEKAVGYLSERYSLPASEIYSVMSFYGMFNTEKKGKYVIRICDSLSCRINKSFDLEKYIWGMLNIKPGQTTRDNKFTLEIVDCLGLCDQAPAMMVNQTIYGQLDVPKLMHILRQLQEKG